jgi:hypothetical protein
MANAPQGNGNGSTVCEIEAKMTRLPLFYGNTPGHRNEVSPKDLVNRIEADCRATNKPANTECQELYLTLRGEAIGWWDSMEYSETDKTNWQQLKKEFLRDYDYRISDASSYRLTTLKQKSGETVVSFFARVSHAVKDMYDGMSPEADGPAREARQRTILHTHKNLFISGLRENLRSAVLNHPIPTLKEAKEEARRAEYLQGREQPKPTTSMWEEVSSILDTVLDPADRGIEDEDFHEEEVAAINHWRANHRRRPVKWTPRRRLPPSQNTGLFQGKCYNCDKPGHRSRDCREPRRNPLDDQNQSEVTTMKMSAQKPSYALSFSKNW